MENIVLFFQLRSADFIFTVIIFYSGLFYAVYLLKTYMPMILNTIRKVYHEWF